MNESIPSSVQPAHAPQKPTICERLSGVRCRATDVRSVNEFIMLLQPCDWRTKYVMGTTGQRARLKSGAPSCNEGEDIGRWPRKNFSGLSACKTRLFIYNI